MSAKKETNDLFCGCAQVDITPELNTQMSGAVGVKRSAEEVLDPLYARALVLSDNRKKVCFISLDLTIINKNNAEKIRSAAVGQGFDHDAVMVHVIQTHTAPSLGRFMLDDDFPNISDEYSWLRGGSGDYEEVALEKITEAIKTAETNLEPVLMGGGRAIEGRISFNRRAVTTDGNIVMPSKQWNGPLGPADYLSHLEGPIDPELLLLGFSHPDNSIKSMLLHHTCHPVCVFPRPVVSADWPGAWCREMKDIAGDTCVPIVANGCCGNINPWSPFDPAFIPDHLRMGQILAQTSETLLNTIEFESTEGISIDFSSETVRLPIREVEPKLLDWARKLIEENPQPVWADTTPPQVDGQWFRAANILSLELQRRREHCQGYEIQLLRIGDTAIVGLPGEPFVEGQLRIKLASPAKRTFVAHCVNQYVGYVPTREAFNYPYGHRGHEVDTSTWAKLTPDALDIVVEKTATMLNELFQNV